jgi:hypothetical protein
LDRSAKRKANQMRQRRLCLALGIALILVTELTVTIIRTPSFQKSYRPPVLDLPADDEVVEMQASLRESWVGFEAVPEFVFPEEHVPVILSWLRPAEYIREGWRLDTLAELGEVVIRTRNGRELRLHFYWAGKNPAVLTPNGEDQFYGRGVDDEGRPVDGGIGLGKAVRDAYKALPW